MLILLPPSEGKTAPTRGEAVDLKALSFPELTMARRQVVTALTELSQHPEALTELKLGESLRDELVRNINIWQEPTAPAHRIYTGVLYEALGYQSMTPTQRRKAQESVLVISALWGAVRLSDHIPAYRLPMTTTLPGLGQLSSYWRPLLTEQVAPFVMGAATEGAATELVVDCRSSSYATAWRPLAENTVVVNVFQLRNGARHVVSHFAKHHRGELARYLLSRRGRAPQTPQDLLKVTQQHWEAELVSGTSRKPHQLNLILPE